MEILKILSIVIQMGTAFEFPTGESSLQQPLADKIQVECKDNLSGQTTTFHMLGNNPKFKKTTTSLFTEDNTKSLYIFLTQIDSTYLFAEDCDYSLLKFLRYRTAEKKSNYSVVDSTDYIVHEEALRLVRFSEPVTVRIFENGTVFETSFSTYMEYWECPQKIKYGTKYSFIKPKPTPLRKNYSEEESEDLKYILTHPLMVFSIIPVDDLSYDLPFNIQAKSVETSLEKSGGGSIEGHGIDLNDDKVLDAFWYWDIKNDKPAEVYTRLYVNIDGKWVPRWYTYFKEF
jgi:hypothetical protein